MDDSILNLFDYLTIPFLFFLRDGEKPIRIHSFASDQIAETKEKIIKVAAEIRNRKFGAKTGRHWEWYDYKNLTSFEQRMFYIKILFSTKILFDSNSILQPAYLLRVAAQIY